MDAETREMLGRLAEGHERIESYVKQTAHELHRALHGSEPDTAGIYKRLDRIEQEARSVRSVVKWVGGALGAAVTALTIKWFGGGDQ